MPRFRKVAGYRTTADLVAHAASLGVTLPCTERDPGEVLSTPWSFADASRGRIELGNRWTILPMEGWDGEADGAPGAEVERRWLRFATSGAKLLWFEATAVRRDGRANPRQLVLTPQRVSSYRELLTRVHGIHRERFGASSPPLAGLQLTHSGRWCRPEGPFAPRIVYRHPELDPIAGVEDDAAILSDAEIEALIGDFVAAAVCARDAGFDFVDVKHCHGYFSHELLSAYDRPAPFGGSLENRTRFLREICAGIRQRAPELAIAVRLSAHDVRPHRAGSDGVGVPVSEGTYAHGFGTARDGLSFDLDEASGMLAAIRSLGVGLVCITAGSPYYCPHAQRPAYYPPSDGYLPPRDPLVDVASLLAVTRQLARRFPDLGVVGTGFTYLQEHLPAIAAGCVEHGWMHSPGLGRAALSYPHLPEDVRQGRSLAKKLICRTFSDCTTAPRNGLVSGCYPLDELYRRSEAYVALQALKRTSKTRSP